MILNSITEITVLGTAKKQLNEDQKDWCASYKINLEKTAQAILQAAYLNSEMNIVGTVLENENASIQVESSIIKEDEIKDAYVIYIEMMLDEFPELIYQFLQMAIDKNKVLPKEFIPRFLDKIKIWNSSLRNQAILITGERANYLAQYTKRWDFLLPSTINWETASHKQRIAYALKTRINNPSKALTYIETGYLQNHSKERDEFLTILKTNLSENDLVFIRKNLNDRSKIVRQKAYTLLSIIDKQIQDELLTEARKVIQIEKGSILSKPSLEVVLSTDSEWFNQLPTAAQNRMQIGIKGQKLLNLISLLPFSFYELEPTKTLKLIAISEWNNMFFQGLQNAVILHQDTEWAMALIPFLQNAQLSINTKLLEMLSYSNFNTILEEQISIHRGMFKYSQPLGYLFINSQQAINTKNGKVLIKQLSHYYKLVILYNEDLKIIKNILSRIDWEIEKLPIELEEFNDVFTTKQKLKESLK